MTPRDLALQRLFDLMANKKIRLTIEGEMGEVDAELKVIDPDHPRVFRTIAEVVGAEDFEGALIELLDKAKTR